MNYNQMMEDQITKAKAQSKLLLHVCCAPCSSAVLERLASIFQITCFFYNPNITDEKEYQKRYQELENFLQKLKTPLPIELLKGPYHPAEFFKISKGLEQEPERGKRCHLCYQLRLTETAKIAEEQHFDFFATTLTLSPYKDSDAINEIGKKLEKDYCTTYLYSDFKKKNGYKRSIELSKEYQLYRQDYCGCIYSKRKKDFELAKDMI